MRVKTCKFATGLPLLNTLLTHLDQSEELIMY